MKISTPVRVAIIGGGPRALAAAEALIARSRSLQIPLALTVFEPHTPLGSGPNYDPHQPTLNRLNIPLRAIDVPPPETLLGPVGSFQDWVAVDDPDAGPDEYPARATLGRFLAARWAQLAQNAGTDFSLTVVRERALALQGNAPQWLVLTASGTHGSYGDVLLALGHQSVTPDRQLARWRDHARSTAATLIPAYPSSAIVDASSDWTGRVVAIRGLGLSTIDVIRLLSVGTGGRFEEGTDGLFYHRSGREPARIVPFSLDGLPPAPKPATAERDGLFDITAFEVDRFSEALSLALGSAPDTALDVVCATLADIAAEVFARLDLAADRTDAALWLIGERDAEHTQPRDDLPPGQVLADYLAMARGTAAPSVGYVIGQIWRKLQTPLRLIFNPANVPPATAAALIAFDEGLKRYSYGPPAAAAAEMLALIDAGLLDLRPADDPDILTCDGGWRLSAENGEATASVMIDAVLPPADITRVDTPLLADLYFRGLITPAAESLGIATGPDGQTRDRDGRTVSGLSVLGRMALGSVIATDSVHDCFGAAVRRWADGVMTRASS